MELFGDLRGDMWCHDRHCTCFGVVLNSFSDVEKLAAYGLAGTRFREEVANVVVGIDVHPPYFFMAETAEDEAVWAEFCLVDLGQSVSSNSSN